MRGFGSIKTNVMIKENVIEWAKAKDLLKPENAAIQAVKLDEEIGETSGAFLKNNRQNLIEEIGDVQVVLEILSHQLSIPCFPAPIVADLPAMLALAEVSHRASTLLLNILYKESVPSTATSSILGYLAAFCEDLGISMEECYQVAYDKISGRVGKTVGGRFIKDAQ